MVSLPRAPPGARSTLRSHLRQNPAKTKKEAEEEREKGSVICWLAFCFMAKILSNMAVKGFAESTRSFRSAVAFGSFHHQGIKYSTVTSDSDTHEDFQPTSKLASSSINVKDIVEQDVKENPVMIYMKGIPDAPRCGFSALAVRVFKEYGVPISARNILEDQVLKNSVKTFSNWPTFPQIFIKGEFIGGSDIILNMHQTGELKEKLKDITPDTMQEKA